MADPSGASTVTPDYIVSYKNSEDCVTCYEAFVQYFEATSSGANYNTAFFGLTSRATDINDAAEDTPTLADTMITSTPEYGSVMITVTGGNAGDYVYCTLLVDTLSGQGTATKLS